MDKEIDEVVVHAEVNGVHSEGSVSGKGSELSKSTENVSSDVRLKRRAKRATRQSSKDGVTNGAGVNVVENTRRWKNTRRPRNKYGRGLPKKGNFMLFEMVFSGYWQWKVKSLFFVFYNTYNLVNDIKLNL